MPVFKPLDFQNIVNPKAKAQFLRDFISECEEGDPVQLSDLLANKSNWGGQVLQVLGNATALGTTTMTWKLKVVCDEWGNNLTQGDIVTKKIKTNLKDHDGKPIDPSVLSSAILDGSYDKRFTATKKFKVDKRGCIECNFEDAVHFLNVWGLHSVTGRTLTTKKETSREPEDCPNGQKLHCHYWRYKEVTAEQYKALPILKERTALLRGIDTLELIETEIEDAKLVKQVTTEKRRQQIIEEAKK